MESGIVKNVFVSARGHVAKRLVRLYLEQRAEGPVIGIQQKAACRLSRALAVRKNDKSSSPLRDNYTILRSMNSQPNVSECLHKRDPRSARME